MCIMYNYVDYVESQLSVLPYMFIHNYTYNIMRLTSDNALTIKPHAMYTYMQACLSLVLLLHYYII